MDNWAAETLPWLEGALDEHFKKPIVEAMSRPERVGIEITNACNLNCAMCNTKLSIRKPSLMKLDDYRSYIRDIVAWIKPSFIELYTIGETFLHPQLGDMVEIAYENGLDVHLSTNAQFPEQVARLYTRFLDRPPKLFLSVDGATKETFESIRVGGRFERVFDTLDKLRQIEDRSARRLPLYLRSILAMTNIKEVPKFFSVYGHYFASSRNINFQLINGISPDKAYFREAVPFDNLIYKKPPCHMPFRNLYITVDGRLTPCARDYDADLALGNYAASAAKLAWESPEAERLRSMHRGDIPMTEKTCLACEDTYRLARTAANEYIHYFMSNVPDVDSLHIGLIELLSALSFALETSATREQLATVIAGSFKKLSATTGDVSTVGVDARVAENDAHDDGQQRMNGQGDQLQPEAVAGALAGSADTGRIPVAAQVDAAKFIAFRKLDSENRH